MPDNNQRKTSRELVEDMITHSRSSVIKHIRSYARKWLLEHKSKNKNIANAVKTVKLYGIGKETRELIASEQNLRRNKELELIGYETENIKRFLKEFNAACRRKGATDQVISYDDVAFIRRQIEAERRTSKRLADERIKKGLVKAKSRFSKNVRANKSNKDDTAVNRFIRNYNKARRLLMAKVKDDYDYKSLSKMNIFQTAITPILSLSYDEIRVAMTRMEKAAKTSCARFYEFIARYVLPDGNLSGPPSEEEWVKVNWVPLKLDTVKRKMSELQPGFYNYSRAIKRGPKNKKFRRKPLMTAFESASRNKVAAAASVTFKVTKRNLKLKNWKAIEKEFSKVSDQANFHLLDFKVNVTLPTSPSAVQSIMGVQQKHKIYGIMHGNESNNAYRPFMIQAAKLYYRKRLSSSLSLALKRSTSRG